MRHILNLTGKAPALMTQTVSFEGAHILSVGQFDRASIKRVFDVADSMEPYAQRRRITRVLEGAILSNMFFEPSTRTRISFGSAFNLLGGEVRETSEVKASSLTNCLLYTSPSPRDRQKSRMPSSA